MAQAPLFGELLRRARVAAGLTQEALAERAGLSATAISALERGVRQTPQGETLRLLTNALALPDSEQARLAAAARRLDARSGTIPAASSLAATGAVEPHAGCGVAGAPLSEAEAPVVYLAHARADRALVARLGAELLAHGIRPWRGAQELQPGSPGWEQDARDAIRAARAILYLGSPEARASRYVADELRVAELYRRPIYPLWLAGEAWLECVPLGWGGMQYLDARGGRSAAALDEVAALLRGDQAPAAPSGALPNDEAQGTPRNPYKGLRAFDAADAGDFFGRESAVGSLLAALAGENEQAPRFLAVVGPSGSGKSSLVLAGLLPRLRRGALPGSAGWIDLPPVVPGAHPLEALSVALAASLPASPVQAVHADLEASARGLHLLGQRLAPESGRRVVLVADQFEELFTLAVDEAERQHCIDLLVTAATESRGPVLVILTLRADFFDRPLAYPELAALFDGQSKAVLPMTSADLRAAIEGPAALTDVQLTFEGDLVGDLLFEVRGQAGALPLLEFTLEQLVLRRDGHRLTLAAYQALGGVRGALARHAEAVFAGLPSEEQRHLCRALFLRLITPGASEQETMRRRAGVQELVLEDAEQTRLLQATAEAFIAARLLSTSDGSGGATIEVSHEALLREWERLGAWLQQAWGDIRLQQSVSADAAEWERQGWDPDYLYRGALLLEARGWAARNLPSVSEAAFVAAGVAAEAQRAAAERERQAHELALERRAASRLRVLTGALLAFLAVAAGLATVAINAANTARTSERQEAAAKATALARRDLALSTTLALQSVSHLDDQTTLALLLSVQANRLASTVEARGALLQSFQHQHSRLVAVLRGDPVGAAGVSFSPDGRRLSAVGVGGTVRQWDVATLRQQSLSVTVPGVTSTLAAVTISADGTLMACSSAGAPVVWDLLHGHRIGDFSTGSPAGAVTALAFNADGTVLVAAYTPNVIRLWDVAHQRLIGSFVASQQGAIDSMAFSPDGRTLAVGSDDGSLWLWDAPRRRAIAGLLENAALAAVSSVTFSPDGSILASNANGRVQLWDVAHRRPFGQSLAQGPQAVYSVAFSHDGAILASASTDGSVQLWSMPRGQPLGAPLTGSAAGMAAGLGYGNGLADLAFSPDDGLLASGGQSDAVRLWDVSAAHTLGLPLPGSANPAAGVAMSPDGSLAASAGANKTILVWDLAGRRLRCSPLAGHTDYVNSLAFSPDGRILASGADDATIRLWDVAHCRPLGAPLADPAGAAVESLAFGGDGRVLVAGNADASVRLWDVSRRQVIGLPLVGPAMRAWSVAVSRDGRMVASGNLDGSVWLWHLWSGDRPGLLLSGHTGAVYSVACSPDGRTLATGGADGTIRLWDTATARAIGAPLVANAVVRSVAFSPDGATLASAGDDESIRLWDVATQLAVGPSLTGHTGGVWGVAFGPGGKTLVSVGTDQTLRTWTIDPAVLERRVCQIAGRNLTPGEWQHYLGGLPYQKTCAAYP